MKIPFKLLKCKNVGCEKKATHTVNEWKTWYCDKHYHAWKADFNALKQWIMEQDEKWEQNQEKLNQLR